MNDRDAGKYNLGVLFVHGIGNQTRGSTLTEFGTPLVEWFQERARLARGVAVLGHTTLTAEGGLPATSELTIGVPATQQQRRWLLAESWWAQSFATAEFREVARWSLLIVPWTIGTHFARRFQRADQPPRRRISALAALVAALLLSPVLLAALAILLILGSIPWPQLQNAVAKIQLTIASSLGDSYMLVTRPIEAAAIRTKVRADLDWMLAACERVAVIAHSQGAALAAQAISAQPSSRVFLLTFGSGLRKLEELASAHRRGGLLRGALLSVAGLCIGGLMVLVLPLVAYQAYNHEASPASVLTVLTFAAAGLMIGIGGIQDFLHNSDPLALDRISNALSSSHVQWHDLYASADPVPNGKLRNTGDDGPTSEEVVNLGSFTKDHTTYWRNLDGFVVRVAEKLIAFDDAHILEAPDQAARAFLSGQRAVRVGVLRIINWATVACAVVLLSAFRLEWFSVAAWASGRALAWMVRPFGVTLPAVASPNAAVLSRTVGWLAAVLAINWLVRLLWAVWNNSAMEDATRGVYATRAPVGLFLALLVQLFLAFVAVQDLSKAFPIAAGGILCLVIGVTLAQRRHAAPSGLQSATATEASSSATLVFRALLQIVGTGLLIVGVPGALIGAAQAAQTYVAEHFGRRASWVLVSFFILWGVFLVFAAFRAVTNWWRDRAKRAHV